MIKLVCFFRRNPSMSREEFHHHWLENHGPLIAGEPTLTRHLVRYEQNHRLGTDYDRPDAQDFDGATVQWMESMKSFAAFIAEPAYRELIAPDEARFLDQSSIALLFTEQEDVKREGPQSEAAIKLLGLLRRKPGLTPSDFHAHWSKQHAELVLGTPEFAQHIVAYHQNHRHARDYARDTDAAPGWDGMAEVWLRSPESFASMAGSSSYDGVIAPDEERFIDRRSMAFLVSGPPDVIC